MIYRKIFELEYEIVYENCIGNVKFHQCDEDGIQGFHGTCKSWNPVIHFDIYECCLWGARVTICCFMYAQGAGPENQEMERQSAAMEMDLVRFIC